MKKVLIADDEKEIREILESAFRLEMGFENITFASDGLDAFTECSLQKFDIICLDHSMPYLSGADFLVALRAKNGLNQQTPVVMVSAFVPELSAKLNTLENIFFVEKPIDFTRLNRYVKMAVR